VTQTPLVNAGAVGVDHPFIILHSAAVELLNRDEMRTLIAHEMGHVISGHALYRTITILILELGFQNLPFLAGLALLPVKLALLEWSRKSELSADRAGLLGSQDAQAAMWVNLKLAGGVRDMASEMDLKTFMDQAREYQDQSGVMDTLFKILNTLGTTHPFNTLRAAELERWIATGDYDRIVAGQYTRRGAEEAQRPLRSDLSDAAGFYAREAKKTVETVAEAARKAAQNVSQAFRDATKR
jgi:Zn-dependent protease with chaperone function